MVSASNTKPLKHSDTEQPEKSSQKVWVCNFFLLDPRYVQGLQALVENNACLRKFAKVSQSVSGFPSEAPYSGDPMGCRLGRPRLSGGWVGGGSEARLRRPSTPPCAFGPGRAGSGRRPSVGAASGWVLAGACGAWGGAGWGVTQPPPQRWRPASSSPSWRRRSSPPSTRSWSRRCWSASRRWSSALDTFFLSPFFLSPFPTPGSGPTRAGPTSLALSVRPHLGQAAQRGPPSGA